MGKMVKIEHPGLGATSYVLEESVFNWGAAGWFVSEDQPLDPEVLEAESERISLIRSAARAKAQAEAEEAGEDFDEAAFLENYIVNEEAPKVEAKPKGDVTPVGDSEENEPEVTGDESPED